MLADDACWYVVAVEPHAENAVSTRASCLDIATYFPVARRVAMRRRRLEARTAPAMPGYVFVAGQHFSAFRRDLDGPEAVPHCIGWLSGSQGPEPVQPPVVEEIKRREAKGEFDSSERIGKYWAPRWLKPKAKVRITDGPFKGVAGEVWRMTGARKVAIFILMLGAPTLTECPIEAVSRAR